ncbi:MAG: hypothetical protein AB7G47_07320 [Mycolicibacterium sp.]|uniref:hypothetical protein n=1 Tax=Mycolicibacterium sp. TaxID=2320850 RepID=UPI003D0CF485
MATLTQPSRVPLGHETRERHLNVPANSVAQLEQALEKRTLEMAVLEYFWDR